jgi:FkbM family methyltransferase
MDSSDSRTRALGTFVERLKQNLLLFLRRRGFELSKLNEAPQFATMVHVIRSENLRTVIDVGANEGQFGRGIRSAGFDGFIISLEPLADPYRRLAGEAAGDRHWRTMNVALSDGPGERSMAAASNLGMSSSFLEMTPAHRKHAPGAVDGGTQTVATVGWHELASELPDGPSFLKLDLQGYEGHVLRQPDAVSILDRSVAVLIELSCTELYEGAWSAGECISFMESNNFEIYSLFPEWFDRGELRLLQFNVLFVRRSAR